jgi:hypothetical protein
MRKITPRFYSYIFLALIALFIVIGLSSCGCNYHLKKAEKKCGYSTSTEVVTIRDTIYTDRVVKDTIFSFTNSSDTIVLKQNNLQIKYYYNSHDSTVYIKGECKTDTIYKDRVITVNNKNIEFSFKEWVKSNLIWLFVSLFVLAVLYLFLRFFKR